MSRAIPPIPIDMQIDLAIRNMLLVLQTGLHTSAVRSLAELEQFARIRERRLAVAREFRPPPPPTQALHADFGFNRVPAHQPFVRNRNFPIRDQPRLTNLVVDELIDNGEIETELDDFPNLTLYDNQGIQELANLRTNFRKKLPCTRKVSFAHQNNSLAAVIPEANLRFCFNCGSEDGHMAQSCILPCRIFCRNCGKFGKTRNNCDVCPIVGEKSYCGNCGRTNESSATCPDCKKSKNS